MRLSKIAIKVTNRNRKAVIAWLESINKPSDNKYSYIRKLDCYLMYINGGFIVDIDNEEDRVVVKLSQAKRIYQKENRPQPTHDQLKSERGRSAMYKMKYEQLRKDYNFDKITFEKTIKGVRELNEEVSTLKRKLDVVNREYERTNEQLVSEKQQMVIANGKTIKELDLYKGRVVELKNEINTFVKQNSDLIDKLEQSEGKLKRLHSELLSSKRGSEGIIETLKAKIENQTSFSNDLIEERNGLYDTIIKSDKTKDELRKELKEVRDGRLSEITYLRKVSKNLLIASALLAVSLIVSLVYILK